MNDEGEYKCTRPGCGIWYTNNTNNNDDDIVCECHDSLPIFHDLMKTWPCCNKSHTDWDQFINITKCKTYTVHQPKHKH